MQSNPIHQAQFRSQQIQPCEMPKNGVMLRSDYCNSTLVGDQNGSILGSIGSVLFAPLRWIGQAFTWLGSFLKRTVFGFCHFNEKDKPLDWHETKEIFTACYAAVCTATDASTDRIKRFDKAFKALSEPAKEKYRQHIAFIMAEGHGVHDRAQQEAWYQKQCKEDDNFLKTIKDDYFNNIIGNKSLQKATRNFQEEIDRMVK